MLTLYSNKIYFCLLLLCIYTNSYSQSNDIDSLLNIANNASHDSIRGKIYYDLAKTHYLGETNKALEWAKEGAKYFKKLDSINKMTLCMNIEAVCLFILDKYDESAKLQYQILKIREEQKDTVGLSETLLNIGNIYYRGKDADQAIALYRKSHQYALKKKNAKLLALTTNNIGNYYVDKYELKKLQKDRKEAIKYLTQSIYHKEKLKTDKTLEISYLALSRLYFDEHDLPNAYQYAIKADELGILNRNDEAVGTSKIMLGKIALTLHNFQDAQKIMDDLHVYIVKNKSFHLLNTFDKDIIEIRSKIRNKQTYMIESSDSTLLESNNDLLLSRQKLREELNIKYNSDKKELENKNLLLINKIEKEKSSRIQLFNFISIFFAIALLVLFLLVQRKNKTIKKSEISLKNQSEKLKLQNELLQEAQLFKAKLISIISHDIRSPLHSLASIIEISKETDLTTEEINFIMPKISQELSNTSQLLNDLLFWSQGQIKGIKTDNQWIEINEIINKSTGIFQTQIESKKLQILSTIDSEMMVLTDENKFEFILRNLLHNAIKYSNINKTIEVSILRNETNYILSIKDHGIGMSMEELNKMFKSDIKSTKGTMNEQGSGVALLLCQDFIKSLGWELQIESTIKVGSTFNILIPIQNIKNLKTKENSSLELV